LQKAFSINENAHNLSVIKLKALNKAIAARFAERGGHRLPERVTLQSIREQPACV